MDPSTQNTDRGTLRRPARKRSPIHSALRLLAALALVIPGMLVGCEGGTTFVGGSFTVGCGTVDETECPPHWTLTVLARAAADGQPIPGALAAITRNSFSDTLRTDLAGRAYISETGPFSPCSVLCGDLDLGTTDCLAWGQTDTLTSVVVSAQGFNSRSGTVLLTRESAQVLLDFSLPSAP